MTINGGEVFSEYLVQRDINQNADGVSEDVKDARQTSE